jgi:outer membrane protein TolC
MRCRRLPRTTGGGVLLAACLAAGCLGRHKQVILPPVLSDQAIHDRVLPPGAPPARGESADLPPPRRLDGSDAPATVEKVSAPEGPPLSLPDAVAFALDNNPRLRVLEEQVAQAKAGEDIAFAPFLPQVQFSYRFSGYNQPVLPAASVVPAVLNSGQFALSIPEIGTQWTVCDFGRRSGRYGQAVAREQIAALHLSRGRQTIAYEVANAYFHLLLARSTRRVREQAVVQAEAVLKDTEVRRKGGTADRNAVLRADVELAATREELVAAQEMVFDTEARLNVTLGRPISLPVRVVDITAQPPFGQSLEDALQQAIVRRQEIGIAREAVAEAMYGVQAARGECLPHLYIKAAAVRVDSPGDLSANLLAAGIHFDQAIFSGGARFGEIRKNQAAVRVAVAQGQVILDNIALEVNLAFRAIAAARERIRLGEAATAQGRENLRLTLVKYNNGDATPTDVVDAQTALTAALMRYYSALYDYLDSLAQLDYATGGDQGALLGQVAAPH